MSQDIYNKLILGGLFSTIGDIFMKKWSINENNDNYEYIFGFIFYNIGIYLLVSTFKEKNITTSVVVYILFNIISFAIINSIYFHDHLNSTQIFGLIMSICAIYLLEHQK
jgi:multidrug transporter EmrE-like cation transporter